jgi:hypothetical protein
MIPRAGHARYGDIKRAVKRALIGAERKREIMNQPAMKKWQPNTDNRCEVPREEGERNRPKMAGNWRIAPKASIGPARVD